jgi:hypothetical protein
MFTPNSRYAGAPIETVRLANGREVSAVRIASRTRPALLGYHRRLEGQRLDLLSAHYLKDPTAFWRICDANAARSPHALAVRALIGIPAAER